MLKFFDLIMEEEVTLAYDDVLEITANDDGNVLIENVDGLIYEASQVLFI